MERLLEVAELAEVHYGLKRVDPTDTKCTPTGLSSRRNTIDQPIRAAKEESGAGQDEYVPAYNDPSYGDRNLGGPGYGGRNPGNQDYGQSYRNTGSENREFNRSDPGGPGYGNQTYGNRSYPHQSPGGQGYGYNDTGKAEADWTGLCYRCGEGGHYARECQAPLPPGSYGHPSRRGNNRRNNGPPERGNGYGNPQNRNDRGYPQDRGRRRGSNQGRDPRGNPNGWQPPQEPPEKEKNPLEPAVATPVMVIGKGGGSKSRKAEPESDVVGPKAVLGVPVRGSTAKGWLAPVYINDVFLLLTADTGAAVTMLNTNIFKRYFPDTELQPSAGNFTTASGDPMSTAGQFRADVQLGPVTIASLLITVAEVLEMACWAWIT